MMRPAKVILPNGRSDVSMAKSGPKTTRKRRNIRNKRLRHLKKTRKEWKQS